MNCTRRQFLQSTTTLLAASAAPFAHSAATASALVGSQLYGWGQYYEREGKKLGEHLDDVLSALRDAGYDYAEGFLSLNADENARFGERCKAKGLQPVCLYTGAALHDAAHAEENVQRLLTAAGGARAAGFRIINCNPDPAGRAKTDAELATQARWLQTFGEELAKLGLQLGVHNHTPEMANHAREFHANFRTTTAPAVGFCYDVHWVFRGGVPPAEALAAYGSRIVSWHLRQSREGVWWEDLDTGDIDYAAIAEAARAQHLPAIYSVELALESGTKITRDAVANHARSRQFVQRIFGV